MLVLLLCFARPLYYVCLGYGRAVLMSAPKQTAGSSVVLANKIGLWTSVTAVVTNNNTYNCITEP